MDESKKGLERGLSVMQAIIALLGLLTVLLGGFLGLYVRLDRIEQRQMQMAEDGKRITALEMDSARNAMRIEQLREAVRRAR